MAPFLTVLSFLYYDNTARERHSVYVISSILTGQSCSFGQLEK
jgi:hypothetical protein